MTNGDNRRETDTETSRRIVIELTARGGNEDPERSIEALVNDKLGPWSKLTDEFPGLIARPRWKARASDEIRELVAKAREIDPTYKPGPILNYVEIVCPPGSDTKEVLDRIRRWDGIKQAWIAPAPQPPPVVATDDPRWPNQGYLDPAPSGIDAEYAWTVAGGDGLGQGFVDIEWGWTLNHQDLVAHGATLLSGVNNGYEGHGTAVLGEVAAVDNALGCVGITPELASVNVIGQWRTATDSDIADAILDACGQMDFGHVLLLEAHTNFNGFSLIPVEAYDDTYEMIRLATALGIIVVEAGGNGGNDLDLVTNFLGDNFFDPSDASFRDSGAIIVGAASSAVPHVRLGFSSYGSRVDCYGWGQNVETTGDGWTGATTTAYTSSFSGTSSASPIIAGAALAVQGVAENSPLGLRFSPAQMRTILTNPATSTASDDPPVDRIGVMPNLRAIIEGDEVNQRPDVYIRDFVGDVGDPHTGSISASPDVILVPIAVADPTAAFGAASGTANSNILGYEATDGQDNFIYVRGLNRGGVDGPNTTAHVYWSPVSTLVTPDLWTLVGSVVLPNLPTGDVLTVSNAITWDDADIPGPGHYCFVAILDHSQDPGPAPADFLNWSNFNAFIQQNNNVTWRNFNVVPSALPPGASMVANQFLMPGAFDEPRRMRLEAVLRLPGGAKAMLRVPEHLVDHFQCGRSPFFKTDRNKEGILIPLNPQGRTRFCDFVIPPKARHELELLVAIPKEAQAESYVGWVSQFEGKQELGRVTWHFTSARELEKRDAHLKKFS